jgi:hypothetical protein
LLVGVVHQSVHAFGYCRSSWDDGSRCPPSPDHSEAA